MLLHERHKDDTGSTEKLVNTNVKVAQAHHTESSGTQIKDAWNGQKEEEPHGCSLSRGRLCCGGIAGVFFNKRPFFVDAAVSILFVVVGLLGRFVRRRHIAVVVAGKGNLEVEDHFVHDQPKEHANKHTKSLKEWLFKEFIVPVNAYAVQFHHGFGANAAGRTRNDGQYEKGELPKATSLCRR